MREDDPNFVRPLEQLLEPFWLCQQLLVLYSRVTLPVLRGFLGHRTFGAKTGHVPGKLGGLVTLTGQEQLPQNKARVTAGLL